MAAKGQQKHNDQKTKSQVFSLGDRVLVKLCHVEDWQKLGDRWESCPNIVVEKQPNIPVYGGYSRGLEDGGKMWREH